MFVSPCQKIKEGSSDIYAVYTKRCRMRIRHFRPYLAQSTTPLCHVLVHRWVNEWIKWKLRGMGKCNECKYSPSGALHC